MMAILTVTISLSSLKTSARKSERWIWRYFQGRYLSRSCDPCVRYLISGGVALGSPPIEYVKEDHPPKLEGVLARIQKNWVAQKRALAKATARQYSAAKIVGENINVVLEPRPGRLSESIDFAALSDIWG